MGSSYPYRAMVDGQSRLLLVVAYAHRGPLFALPRGLIEGGL